MTFTLRTYLFMCLGLIAVAPVLLLGGLQTQRLAELQLAQSDRETSLAAEVLAREVAQLMQTHSDAVEALSRQVEAQGGLDRQVALYRPGSDGDVELRSDTDENGVAMRAAIARVPLGGLNWTVVMARSEAEVRADETQAQRQTLIGAGLALIGGLILAAALSSVFARPITVLAAVAAAVGHGDLSTPSPPETTLASPRSRRTSGGTARHGGAAPLADGRARAPGSI